MAQKNRMKKNLDTRIAFTNDLLLLQERYPDQFKIIPQTTRRKMLIDEEPITEQKAYLKSLAKPNCVNPKNVNFIVEVEDAAKFKKVVEEMYGKNNRVNSAMFRMFMQAVIESKNEDLINPGVIAELFKKKS